MFGGYNDLYYLCSMKRKKSVMNTTIATTSAAEVNEAISLFLLDQDVNDLTRRAYRRGMECFIQWTAQHGRDLAATNRATILEFKAWLTDNLADRTAAAYLTAVRRFYSWLEGTTGRPNPAASVHNPRITRRFARQHLTKEEARELTETGGRDRDRIMIELMLSTGLRTIEVIRADVGDLQRRAGKWVLYIQGKGHTEKDSFVIVPNKVAGDLQVYNAGQPASAPLFRGEGNRNNGKRITTRTIRNIVRSRMDSIGLTGSEYTAHSLRHTTAVTILLSGGNIFQAQATLRHSSPATTEIYTATIAEAKRLEEAAENRVFDFIYCQ